MAFTTRLSWTNGLDIGTAGDLSAEPDVVAPPVALPEARIVAFSIDSVIQDGTDFMPVGLEAEAPCCRQRVVIGGKDFSFPRGIQTPFVPYQLVAPLLYGAATLSLPQFHAVYERAGHGDLSAVKKHAKVRIQRVDADDNVVDTDFVGLLADDQRAGKSFTWTVGGEVAGRASTQYRPVPVFPKVRDIGPMVMRTIAHKLRRPTANEPTTGVEMAESGGMSQLDWISDTLAKSTTLGGAQWTVMPNSNGKYRMFQKDLETIDATLYIDGARVQQSLRRDYAEEHNRIFSQSISPDGMHNRHWIVPGVVTTKRTFPGTTLHPGDSSDDVTAMIWRLFAIGALNHALGLEWTVDLHDDVTEAIKDVQDDAGLNIDGDVNAATWRAIFRGDTKSLNRAQQVPTAKRLYTNAFLTDATGNILGPNPAYDRGRPLVDRNVGDMGYGITPQQDKKWCKGELSDDAAPNWLGTITVYTGAVIDGEHNPGDPLTADLVRDARSLIPGQNLWVPNWDGGTLFHVSGASVSQPAPGTIAVEYLVDTRARDTMEVWEIRRRNKDARKTPARLWEAQYNRSGLSNNDGGGYDGGPFGKIERTFCPADTWTVIPSVAGRSGMLDKIGLKTSTPVELAVEIWDRERDTDWMDRKIGDWNTVDFWDHLNSNVNDWKKNRGLIDHWGSIDQPAGYGHAAKFGPDAEVTAAVLTGDFNFDAGAPYFCHGKPVLWIAVRPLEDCYVTGGLDDGRALKLLLGEAAD